MSRHLNAALPTLIIAVGVHWTVAVGAERAPEFTVGARVEVDYFDQWRPGTVTSVSARHRSVDVLLDAPPDVPPAAAAMMPKETLRAFRQVNVSAEDVRLFANGSGANPPGKPRQWTSKNGKHRVQATFRGLNGDKVVLERTGGKRLEVPLNKLSDSDAEYARNAAMDDENPFDEDPFGDEAGPATSPAETGQLALRKADWSSVQVVQRKSFNEWTFKPESTTTSIVAAAETPIALGDITGSKTFFEEVSVLGVSDDSTGAIVVRHDRSAIETSPFVQLVHLDRGECEQPVPLSAQTAALDVLPEKQLVMYRPDIFGSGENTDLVIAKFDGTKLTTLSAWRPYENVDWEPRRDIKRAWFLSADRVMTVNTLGKALTIWDVDAARALFGVPIGSAIDLKTALSPDRTLLAIPTRDEIAIINLPDGEHCATLLIADGITYDCFAFRPDNRRLAAAASSGITVWDLTTGEVVRQLVHPVSSARGSLTWAGDFLLINSSDLLDTERRILLWQYEYSPHAPRRSEYRGGRLWFTIKTDPTPNHDQTTILRSAEIPHQEAIETARSLGTPESMLAVKQGDAVAIEVDVDPGIGSAEEVRRAIEENVKKAGLVVADESALVLTAICKRQEQQTIKINKGRRFRPEHADIVERTITPHASFLEMKLDGETVFKRGYIARPHMTIWLKQGESLDQALERLTTPNLELLTHTTIPGELGRPGKANSSGAYGVSKVTDDGFVGSVGPRFE